MWLSCILDFNPGVIRIWRICWALRCSAECISVDNLPVTTSLLATATKFDVLSARRHDDFPCSCLCQWRSRQHVTSLINYIYTALFAVVFPFFVSAEIINFRQSVLFWLLFFSHFFFLGGGLIKGSKNVSWSYVFKPPDDKVNEF